ncbi:hydroxymethylglutaryl-CoA lyase [Alicyclobacillus sp. ALC3]|uniref:hydroxymethylglutaryl-CoA lyase n=1 Tax=Alicyclobacillus sp. ALC3 TaxID=2796143 RepID=UPI002378474B|nr:hydroxymethylglutaryl-CoA lyase [Alicyclobacillus sp. ALC3]WDL97456.1 hydroxymethylglutaryl-CoA lyase [Alicyclobacillus sp. ALC3]
MSRRDGVTIVEVGPRDGLQNESRVLSTQDKVTLVNHLSAAGFRHIEVSSFVHPKWIPALADADEVLARITRSPGVTYSALVPNERGLERALSARVDMVNVFMSASESHNRANINKSIVDTYAVLEPVVQGAKAAGLPVRGYVSTAFGCPYEGDVDISQVVAVSERLLRMGVDELSIGDTIGVAVPTQVTAVVGALQSVLDVSKLALHFHDTRGTAIANIVAGLGSGVTVFDASVGGLGGCPYAPGAAGNVATEDVLYLFDKMGLDTGIERPLVDDVAAWLEDRLEKPLPSHARAVRRGQSA